MMEKALYYASFGLGLALAVACSLNVGKTKGLSRRDAASFTVTGFLSGVLGAVLMAQVYNAVVRAVAPGAAFSPSYASLYGGLLLVPALILIPVRLMKADFGAVLDTCAAGVYLLLGAAKLGCFSYGCCYGIDCAFGTVNRFTGTRTFPVQPLETAVSFAVAALLWAVSTGRIGKGRRLPGGAYPLGLVLYGTARFFLQFLRAHEVAAEADLIGFLDLWQIVSCIAVLTGAAWLAVLVRSRGRSGEADGTAAERQTQNR